MDVAFNVVPVIVPAEKLPEESRFTIVLAVLLFVALFAAVVAVATLAAVWPPTLLTAVADCVPVTSPSSEPVKFVALFAVVALVALVAVDAFPLSVAVIVPAAKLPEASRFTIVLPVLTFVALLAAAVAEAIFAAVAPPTVATAVELCVPVTSPESEPVKFVALLAVVALVAVAALPFSAAVIAPAKKLPEASRFTIVLPVFAFVAFDTAAIALCALADRRPSTSVPLVTLEASVVSVVAEGATATPPIFATTVLPCVPVTSPASDPLKLVALPAVVAAVAVPLSVAVIVPAAKLPEPSRFTRVPAVLASVALPTAAAADATLAAV
jgi:hypothetical protein